MLELLLAGRPYDPPTSDMTYDQFVDWLGSHEDQYVKMDGSVTDSSPGASYANKYARIKLTQTTIVMWGTSYKDWFTHDSRWAPITRHACPSDEIFQYMLSNQQYCLLKFSETATRSSYTGITRNGFTSFTMNGDYLGMHLLDFIYYDYTVGKIMRYNPFIDDTPSLFMGDLI
jgi:hypothetical protein